MRIRAVVIAALLLAVSFLMPLGHAAAADKKTTKTVNKTEVINYKTINKNDGSLPSGQTKVLTQGKKGSKKVTYKFSYVNGKQTKKQVVATKITKKAVDKVVAIGTYITPAPDPTPTVTAAPTAEPEAEPDPAPATTSNCDPNYSPCIPYYAGNALNCPDIGIKVRVIGVDHNRFDADGDGYGCDSY